MDLTRCSNEFMCMRIDPRIHIIVKIINSFTGPCSGDSMFGIGQIQRLHFVYVRSLKIAAVSFVVQYHFSSSHIPLTIVANENKTELGIEGQIFAEIFEFFVGQGLRITFHHESSSCGGVCAVNK